MFLDENDFFSSMFGCISENALGAKDRAKGVGGEACVF